jgi:protein-disulfide isomerase
MTSAVRNVVGALVIAAVAATIIAFLPRGENRPPMQPLEPLPADQRRELEAWWKLQPKMDLPFATEPAKVVIIKFNDYLCPPCRGTYFGYEPIVAKYKDRPQDVRFVLKHFPLNPGCNPGVNAVVHAAACQAAAAAVMAVPKGTFDKLSDWFFVHQDELDVDTVKKAARDVGGIADFDAQYANAIQQVKTDAQAGVKLGVGSTPTFFVNARKVAPAVSPAALDALIEIELNAGGR